MRLLATAMVLVMSATSVSLAQPAGARNDPAVQNVEPFQIFDNLYYVGIEWVAAYVIPTSDGLIMIDSLYGDFVDHALQGVRKIGFDPADIKYVLVTHGHFDHHGGAKAIQARTGAQIGMTQQDWLLAETRARAGRGEIPARSLVIADGDTVKLGDTTIKCYVTPGHTPGVLSMEFTVYDNGRPHKAFMFGGVGLNFSGVDRCLMYINSVERIMAMDGIEVNITNHADMGKVFERTEKLRSRRSGEPHPFVAPDDYKEWLDGLMVNVKEKLAQERQ